MTETVVNTIPFANPVTVVNTGVNPITLIGSQGVYDVKTYGAKGDGSTDDRASIEAAFTAALANLPATVIFPPGDYVISGGIAVTPAQSSRGLTIIGAGASATRINFGITGALSAGQYKALDIYPSVTPEIGINTGTSATVMTDADGSFTASAHVGQYIHNVTDPGAVGTITANDTTTITCSGGLSGGAANTWASGDEYMVSDSATDPYSLYLKDIVIQDIGFYDAFVSTRGAGADESHGIDIQYTVGASVKNCSILDIGDEGINFKEVHNGIISGNRSINTPALGTAGGAISTQQGCRRILISDNIIQGSSVDGVRSTIVDQIGIDISIVDEASCRDMKDITVQGNIVTDTTEHGILINCADSTNNSDLYNISCVGNIIRNTANGISRRGEQGVGYNTTCVSNIIEDVDDYGFFFNVGIIYNVDVNLSFNTIKTSASRGILCNGSRLNLSGNNIKDCAAEAIKISTALDVQISGGVIDTCGGAAVPVIKADADGKEVTVEGVQILNYNCTSGQVVLSCERVKNCRITGATPLAGCIWSSMEVVNNTINGGIDIDHGNGTGLISGNHIDAGGVDIGGVVIALDADNDGSIVTNNYIDSAHGGTNRVCINIAANCDNCVVVGNVTVADTAASGIVDAGTGTAIANNIEI